MADWNGSDYRENSSIDEKFLSPKKYFWSISQQPGLHLSRYSEEYWNVRILVYSNSGSQQVVSTEQYCILVEVWNET